MLIKDKSFTIRHQNIQSLGIEIYKATYNLQGGNLSEYFVRNNYNYNPCSKLEILLPNVNTPFKLQNCFSYFGSVYMELHPNRLKKASSYRVFRLEIKSGDRQTALADCAKITSET